MTINHFFLAIAGGLLMIFFFFKPMEIKQNKQGDIPLFEIENFLLHELRPEGLVTLMKGEEGVKFATRYEIKKIDYTDNEKKIKANMQANFGVYQNEVVTLTGDILYTREDGFRFETQSASYNRKNSLAQTNDPYVAYMGANRVRGEGLTYNNLKQKAFSKKVDAVYYLQESKQ
jgi:LPS export ABC transporter protein LptC